VASVDDKDGSGDPHRNTQSVHKPGPVHSITPSGPPSFGSLAMLASLSLRTASSSPSACNLAISRGRSASHSRATAVCRWIMCSASMKIG
jgi:hypothetical protein